MTTTSAKEFAFVATPEATPNGGWPVEEKLVRATTVPTLERSKSVAALVDESELGALDDEMAEARKRSAREYTEDHL